jgi:15-cis-phytoene synthase
MTAADALATVREGDKDRFLATLFASPDQQAGLWPIYAFAVDVARIPARVSEPQLGEIRLQWWRDTVEALTTPPLPDHPLAAALARVVLAFNLPTAPLVAMLEARRFDLYSDQAETQAQVEGYFGETESALFQLATLIVAPAAAVDAANAAGHAGVAFGLARSLAHPTLLAKLLHAYGDVAALKQSAGDHLEQARAGLAQLPPAVLPAFLPLAVVPLYLKAEATPPQWRRQWQIWRAARKEKI